MKRNRHYPVANVFLEGLQIIRKLGQAEQLLNQGPAVVEICLPPAVIPAPTAWQP